VAQPGTICLISDDSDFRSGRGGKPETKAAEKVGGGAEFFSFFSKKVEDVSPFENLVIFHCRVSFRGCSGSTNVSLAGKPINFLQGLKNNDNTMVSSTCFIFWGDSHCNG